MSKNKKQNSQDAECDCNVGEVERVVSAIAGGVLVIKGLKSGSILGIASAVIGAAGIYRAATGQCPLYTAMKINTNTAGQKLSHVAEQAKEIANTVAAEAKEYASVGMEKAQDLTNDARNRVADAIATK